MFEPCAETVSILYAIAFGAGDACVDIGTESLLAAFAAFIVAVIVAQYFARKLWNKLTGAKQASQDVKTEEHDKFKDSAVWSRKR